MTDRGTHRFIVFLLAVFALAAIGCVVLLLLVSGDSSSIAPRPSSDVEGVRTEAPSSGASIPSIPSVAAPAPDATPTTTRELASSGAVSPSDEGPRAPAVPTTLVGQVLDPFGAPAVGAVVELRASVREGARFSVRDIEATKTDDAGRYRITTRSEVIDTSDSALWIVATLGERFGAVVQPGTIERPQENAIEPITLDSGGRVIAHVVDEKGGLVPNAQVTPHGAPGLARKTGGDGVARVGVLPPRKWTLSAVADGYATTTLDCEVVAGATRELEFRLPRALAITGSVADSQDRPLPGVAVAAHGRAGVAKTDEHGAFALDGLAPGSADLRVIAAGFPIQEIASVAVPSQDRKIVLDGPLAFTGKIQDPSSKPFLCDSLAIERIDAKRLTGLAGGTGFETAIESSLAPWVDRVRFGSKGESATLLEPLRDDHEGEELVSKALRPKPLGPREAGAYLDPDGSYRIYGKDLSGCVFLVAKSESYGFAIAGPLIVRAQDPSRVVDLAFGGGCGLDVEVVTRDGSPVRGIDVSLEMFERPIEGGGGSKTTDDSGIAHFDGLCEGEVTAIASSSDGAFATASASTTLTNEKGRRGALRIEIVPGVRVDGIARDANALPLAYAAVGLTSTEGPKIPRRETKADASGRFSFDHVGIRKCTFEIEPSGMIFGKDLAQEDVGLASRIELSSEPRQEVEIATKWPAPCAVATRFILGNASVSAGLVEIRREAISSGFHLHEKTYELESGALWIEGLAPGRYVFAVSPQGGSWYASTVVVLSAGETFSAPLTIETTEIVTGRVEDERGAVIAGASIYAAWKSDWKARIVAGRAVAPYSDLDAKVFQTTTAADGTFRLPPVQKNAQSIVVSARGMQPLSVKADDALAAQAFVKVILKPSP